MINRNRFIALCAALLFLLVVRSAHADSWFNSLVPDLFHKNEDGAGNTAPDHRAKSNGSRIIKKKRSKSKANQGPVKQRGDTIAPSQETNETNVRDAAPKKTSCERARDIVGSYGFADIKPTNCQGRVYTFSAARDGRPFAIKFDAASGELTEVKKLE